MATAAHHADVGHVIWSTFEDTRKYVPLSDTRMPTLQGKYKVPHFDAKAEADHYFSDLGVPTTFLLTSFYWENLIHFGMGPKRGPDGVLAITMPMGDRKLPSLSAEDIGKFAYGLFRHPAEFVDKTVGVAPEHLTGAQMAAALTRALGPEVRYNAVPADVYRAFGFKTLRGKLMRNKIFVLALGAWLIALSVSANAQQAGKIYPHRVSG